MVRNLCFRLICAASFVSSFAVSAYGVSFGGKDKAATAKVERGGPLKGKSTIALGAFRVAFVTHDSVTSTARSMLGGGGGGTAASMTGELTGINEGLMQKIANLVYADFLKQAKDKGYTVIESGKLAEGSAAYRDMDTAENFVEGRLGTFVIPTGQRSVPLAADDSKKSERGAKSLMGGFRQVGTNLAKADANKAFPAAAKEVGAPVVGVTIVVNFANFKGGASHWSDNSKASMKTGATIDGINAKEDVVPATSIQAWDGGTRDCANCNAAVVLEGQIHSDISIGEVSTRSDMKTGDKVANAIGMLGGTGTSNKKLTTIVADPVAYETNVLLVAAEANNTLLTAMAKER